MFKDVSRNWTEDYHRKADRIRQSDTAALREWLHVIVSNAIRCEGVDPDRQLYWLRCSMLAQDELNRR